MTEFTSEFIARARQIIAEGTLSVKEMKTGDHIDVQLNMLRRRAKTEHCEYYYPEALDHIERIQTERDQLKARVQELEIYNKDFHLACINALDLHRESDVPKLKDIPKIIDELKARVQELEKEKRDILIVFDDNITRRDERIEELEMFQDLVNRWSDQYYRDTNKLKQRIAELEQERDYLDTKCAAFENDLVLLDVSEKLEKANKRIVELEEALAKIANYESMRFRLSPYEYGVLEQIVGIAEHALKGDK